MKNVLVIVTALMPLASFSMSYVKGPDKKIDTMALGQICKIIQDSDHDAAAVFGSAPPARSFMDQAGLLKGHKSFQPLAGRTSSTPGTQSELTRALKAEEKDRTTTHYNDEHLAIVFGVECDTQPKTLTRQTKTFHEPSKSFEEVAEMHRIAACDDLTELDSASRSMSLEDKALSRSTSSSIHD